MTGEVHFGMSGSIPHLFLSMERLCASRGKTSMVPNQAFNGLSMTGCSSVLSSDHINGYDTSQVIKLFLYVSMLLLGLIVQCMTSLSLNMSCFFFNLWLSDVIIHVPNVFAVSMLVKIPLDTFLYLSIDAIYERNEVRSDWREQLIS